MKDTFWVTDFKIPGLVMIIPTIGMALYITFKSRAWSEELYHNLAVVCWIFANSIWMIGEFFFNDTLRPFAIVFFSLGLFIIAAYYLPRLWRRKF